MIKEEHKNSAKLPHCLALDNRKNLTLSGVSEVDSFDDKSNNRIYGCRGTYN